MIDKRCFEKGHIKKEAYIILDSGLLDDETRCSISSHLASCDTCSSDYAEYLTDDLLFDVSDEFNKNIIKKVSSRTYEKKYDRFSFFQYLKLATAAVLAISMYSSGIFNSFFNFTSNIDISRSEQYFQAGNQNISQKFNMGFSKFSKKINNLNGVDFYEKK